MAFDLYRIMAVLGKFGRLCIVVGFASDACTCRTVSDIASFCILTIISNGITNILVGVDSWRLGRVAVLGLY